MSNKKAAQPLRSLDADNLLGDGGVFDFVRREREANAARLAAAKAERDQQHDAKRSTEMIKQWLKKSLGP